MKEHKNHIQYEKVRQKSIYPDSTYYKEHQKSAAFVKTGQSAPEDKKSCFDLANCIVKGKVDCDADVNCFGYWVPEKDGIVDRSHAHFGYYIAHQGGYDPDNSWRYYEKRGKFVCCISYIKWRLDLSWF